VRAQSEDKFGFTESERRQILKELVIAEEKAMNEADTLYLSDIYKSAEKYRELEEEYKAQVRAKYVITEEIQREIIVEALLKNWPLK